MVYAYDRAIPLPVKDLYDTQIMNMAINAAKDRYDDAQKRIDDLYTKYGDFMSPIQKDMDWYQKNVTGATADFLNGLYERGIDPLRSAEGRALVAQWTRQMPIGDIAKVRQSAAAANEYLKNKGLLQRAGKYDPDLNERFLGYNLDQFDTINGGQVWNVTSPLEAQSLKDLTEKSFNNRSPLELTKDDVESFGVKYDPRAKYTGFAKRHIQDIADKVAPGLYGTPYMDYYRDLAKRKLEAAGIEPTKDNIDRQLANDIADSQEEWLMGPKADLTDFYKRQELALRAQSNMLQAQRNAIAAGAQQTEQGISLADRWYSTGAAKAWSANGITKNWFDMNGENYAKFSAEAKKVFSDFGKKQHKVDTKHAVAAYQKQFSIPMDEYAVASIIGSPVDGNKKVAHATDAAIARLHSVYDVVTNTAGCIKPHRGQEATQSMRDAIAKAGASNVTITPMGSGYASMRKDGGKFSVMPLVRVKVGDKSYDAYYDIELESATTHGGAYQQGSTADMYNLFPNYNGWAGYGVWDTRETSSQLKGKASESLGTY